MAQFTYRDNGDKNPCLFPSGTFEEISYALIRLRVLAHLTDDGRVNQIQVRFRARHPSARNPHLAPRWAWS